MLGKLKDQQLIVIVDYYHVANKINKFVTQHLFHCYTLFKLCRQRTGSGNELNISTLQLLI